MIYIPTVQASRPCPHCGSWYRNGDRCNQCGAVLPTDPVAHSGSEYLRAKRQSPRPSRGTGWDKSQHKVVYR